MGSNVKKLRRTNDRQRKVMGAERIANLPKMYMCAMIAANGDPKFQPRFVRDLADWLDYNSKYRCGQALFVDGVYQEPDGYVHDFVAEKQDMITEMTKIAQSELQKRPIPEDWHLSEGRYYPPGEDFVSSGSYALDSMADDRSGPYKF